MHSVNLDLLHAVARRHADGRPLDLHAHHRAEHLAALRAARRRFWVQILSRCLVRAGSTAHSGVTLPRPLLSGFLSAQVSRGPGQRPGGLPPGAAITPPHP